MPTYLQDSIEEKVATRTILELCEMFGRAAAPTLELCNILLCGLEGQAIMRK